MQTDDTIFNRFHPAVALVYCGVLLAFSMAAMQPVYLIATFAGLVAYNVVLRGAKAAFSGMLWQAPLVLILAIANPLFVSAGSTELFRIGLHAVYLEALIYGLCQGLMLVNVLLAFSIAARVISSDKVLCVLGNATPTLALMISMTMRLVPQFVRRGKAIADTQKACTAATSARSACTAATPSRDAQVQPAAGATAQAHSAASATPRAAKPRRATIANSLRLSTVLMSWGMEDSLEAADAMRARGWSAATKRTTYQRYRFRKADALACAFIAALTLAATASAVAACGEFSFYPRIAGLAPWFSYIPYVLLVALPTILEVKERQTWLR